MSFFTTFLRLFSIFLLLLDVNVASEPKATGDVPSGINKRSANVTIPLGFVENFFYI